MRKFGIIAEGVTDQIVIENILLGYFDESGLDNDDIGYEQPLLDETDQKRAPEAAGWGMVFKYFELGNELTRKNKPTLVKGEHKLPRSYAKASAPYAEPARLRKLYDKNPSLRIFVENLGALGSKAALTARP